MFSNDAKPTIVDEPARFQEAYFAVNVVRLKESYLVRTYSPDACAD